MIVDIRGTNGSGKSFIGHNLRAKYKNMQIRNPLVDSVGSIEGYEFPDLKLFMLGPYESVSGGCDGIRTQNDICRIIERRAPNWNLFIEGLLVSHTFTRWNNMALRFPGWKFFFLNTPLDICIQRTQARRDAKGTTKPFDPTHLTNDWYSCKRVRTKMLAAGRDITDLDHTRSFEIVEEVLLRNVKV
jgi:hypothetical protein